MTKQYGILAYPAKHSISPQVYNEAFKFLNIDAQFGIFEIPENELDEFMRQVKNDPIYGLSVSLPYKETVMNYLSFIDDDAKKIGAVNTVVNNGGVLSGYNTDFIGSIKALEEVVGNLKSKNVIILGAGGASRAVIYGLLKAGANVIGILNRKKENAEILAKEFSTMFNVNILSESLDNLAEKLPFKEKLLNSDSILIQTTSIWTLNPNISLEEANKFCPKEYVELFSTVMDVVYSPKITPLLRFAKDLNKKIVTGDMMFLYQAIEQFKLIVGEKPPVELMRETVEKILS